MCAEDRGLSSTLSTPNTQGPGEKERVRGSALSASHLPLPGRETAADGAVENGEWQGERRGRQSKICCLPFPRSTPISQVDQRNAQEGGWVGVVGLLSVYIITHCVELHADGCPVVTAREGDAFQSVHGKEGEGGKEG
jgi:hypothetical protein